MVSFAVVAERAHTSIIRSCLNYVRVIGRKDLLSMYPDTDVKDLGYSTSIAETDRATKISTVQKMSKDLPLVIYAALYWPWHLRQLQFTADESLVISITDLLDLSNVFSLMNWLRISTIEAEKRFD